MQSSYLKEKLKSKISLQKISFVLILIIFLSFTTSYSLYLPAFEGPDEQTRYNDAKLFLEGSLPELRYKQEPPLYYTINAGLLSFIDHPETIEILFNKDFNLSNKNRFLHSIEEDFPFTGTSSAVHSLRFLSFIFGIITLIFTYKIAQLVFRGNNWLPLFVMGFVALIPKFTEINSVINNDSLLWALSTIAIFFLIKFTNEKKFKYLILLGIFTGLSILTKPNGIVLYIIVLSTFTYLTISKQQSIKSSLKNFFIFFVISIPAGLWYTIQKIIVNVNPEYLSSGKGLFILFTVARLSSEPRGDWEPVGLSLGLSRITDLDLLRWRMFEMMWSWLGWHVVKLPSNYLDIIFYLSIVAAVGLFLGFVRGFSISNIKLEKNHLVILSLTAGFMLLGMLMYLYFSPTGDIRYSFIAISAYGIFYTIGWYVIFNRNKLRILMIIPLIILIIFNVQLLMTINEYYYHGFLDYKNPFDILLDVYNDRSDLQKAYPEVEEGEFSRFINWAELHGVKENIEITLNKPLIILLKIYYTNEELQRQFPEVITNHELKNLLQWSLEDGVEQNEKLKKGEFYLLRYYKNLQ